MKIAIVYDWLDSWGGVERILLTFHEIFPHAIFYTSYFDKDKAHWAKDFNIATSFIQKAPSFIKSSRALSVPLYPFSFESFNFTEFDTVISVTSSFAKAIITRPQTLHICYLLTPTRFLWTSPNDYASGSFITKPLISHLRKWDLVASQRPDYYISISKTVQERLKNIYNRDSEVMYPPFDIDYWNKVKLEIRGSKLENPSKFYLAVSRLEPYKKIDLLIEAFNQMPSDNLIIVGKGTRYNSLRKRCGKNIKILSGITDAELGYLYLNANALLMPQEEDFGFVSLEAQFFGTPVIAFGMGGARETIREGETGIFFEAQSAAAIHNALAKFSKISYTLKESTRRYGLQNIKKFSKEKFVDCFKKL